MDGDNYDIWHYKIQYILYEHEVLETLTQEMITHEDGNTAQHHSNREAYQSWLKKDYCAHFTMLSSMYNDLIREFK